MAPSSRPGAAPLAAADAHSKPQPSNGVLTTGNSPTGTINRKKAKRRQKQAAKQIATRAEQNADYADDDEAEAEDYQNGDVSAMHNPPSTNLPYSDPYPPESQYDYDNDADLVYSDEEGSYAYDTPPRAAPVGGAIKKSKKKKKGRGLQEDPPLSAGMPGHYPSPLPPPPPGQVPRQATISEEALRTVQRRATKDAIWDTSSQEERLRIKEFWLNLEEEKRKSLVKIEKEAVLRKMKEQQKHSCSCTVCGRKRTAIEEELEVLYDAYYEELEQFANHGQTSAENGITPVQPTANSFRHPMSRGPLDRDRSTKHSRGRIEEVADEDEEDLDEENDDDLSDASYDDDYTSTGTDEVPPENTPASDFFSFGKSLTVKGGILTVADDLLKNDGQKFIDMMEQLAERRMQREEDAAMGPYRVPQHQPLAPAHGQHSHPQAPLEEDEYSDEEDDEDYDSQAEELEDEDDEMDTMTEEQRMEEGRRMFQIFAARMFEQRVLTAYREKVARDRQDMLIAELEGEKDNDKEREAKKQRDALKKKQKKAQQKAAKDQKAQQKAEAEAKAKADEEARQAEQKRKREEQREEQRRKKEEERKKAEDDRAKKEAEKQRRQQLERDKQQEQERKAREAKAEEKRRKEEAKQKEREAREAKEKEARERREQAEHDKRMKEEQTRRDAAAQAAALTPQLESSRRAPPPAKVALPPGLVSASNVSLPQAKIASPVLQPDPVPVRQRDDTTGETQRASAIEHSDPASKQSALPRAPSFPQTSQPLPPISRTISHQGPHAFAPQAPLQPIAPPPGMSHPPNSAMPGFPPVPMSPYGGQVPILPNSGTRTFSGQQLGMYSPGGPHMNHRPGFGTAQHAGFTPGMSPPVQSQHGRAFPDNTPTSYIPHSTTSAQGFGPSQQHSAAIPGHSRQASGSSPIGPSGSAQPIGRPNVGAIKRPASVKPNHDAEVDDLSTHLGSSALLDDDDGPDPLTTRDNNPRANAGLSMPLSRAAFAEPPMRPGFSSPFDHNGGAFGGLAQRLPSNDSTWAPRNHSGQFAPPHAMGGTGGWGMVPTSAPAGSGWGTPGLANASLGRGSTQRPAAIRKLACDACRVLTTSRGGSHAGYSEVEEVLNQMQQMRGDMSIQRREVEEILDTEDPDEHNGGGHFVRMGNRVMHVAGRGSRSGAGLGLGEIGSPIPGLSAPNLPNLGRF